MILINPPIGSGEFCIPPIGLLYAANALKQQGIQCTIIDANRERLTVPWLIERIIPFTDLEIGISVYTDALRYCINLVHALKKHFPECNISVGGPHVTAVETEIFDYMDVNKIYVNEIDESTNLDDIEFTNYSIIDNFNINNYVSAVSSRSPECSIITSRGCPYNCSFCSVTKNYRIRSVENVIEEIKQKITDYNIRYVNFKDSTFNIKRSWVYDFCDKLRTANLQIKWRCNTRANLVTYNLFAEMKKAGCDFVTVGIESGSPVILKNLKKQITVEDIDNCTATLKQLGFLLHYSFIVGSPGETAKTFKETSQLAKKCSALLTQFYPATAYPGTGFYKFGVASHCINKYWYLQSESQNTYGITTSNIGLLKSPFFDTQKETDKAYKQYYISLAFLGSIIFNTFYNSTAMWSIFRKIITRLLKSLSCKMDWHKPFSDITYYPNSEKNRYVARCYCGKRWLLWSDNKYLSFRKDEF